MMAVTLWIDRTDPLIKTSLFEWLERIGLTMCTFFVVVIVIKFMIATLKLKFLSFFIEIVIFLH